MGRGIALELGLNGATVYFTDIDRGRCREVEGVLASCDVAAQGFVSDVSSCEATDELCSHLEQNDVVIDVLVNNAALVVENSMRGTSTEEWREILDTNLVGPMHLTRRVTQRMIDRQVQGSIIFISSMHQWVVSGWVGYSATKSAQGMIIKELALELAPHGIRVNGVAPGRVISDEQGHPMTHDWTPLYRSTIPPQYIGRAVAFLASDYFSRHTTGSVLKVDAGLSLHGYLSLARGRGG